MTSTMPVVAQHSMAAREAASRESTASSTASEIWSHTLSGCPSVTLSLVKNFLILRASYSDFSSLLKEINKIEGRFRLRFMTNHPKDFNEELIKTMSECEKICKSVHLPVQSGSNRILKLMNRHYSREDYFDKVSLLRKYIPDIAITTDIMVGFPGETEEDFLDTMDLVKRIKFAGAFTFIYSKRSGTPAAKMEPQVDPEISKERIMKLISVQDSVNRSYSKSYNGKTIEILCEGYDDKKNKYLGRDVFGRMAYFDSKENLIGQFVNVRISKTGGISLLGDKV